MTRSRASAGLQIVAWHTCKHYATTDHPVGAQITIQELGR